MRTIKLRNLAVVALILLTLSFSCALAVEGEGEARPPSPTAPSALQEAGRFRALLPEWLTEALAKGEIKMADPAGVGLHGSFWSIQNPQWPPFPMNLFPELPMLDLGGDSYLMWDVEVRYDELAREAKREKARRVLQSEYGLSVQESEAVLATKEGNEWAEFGLEDGPQGMSLAYTYAPGTFYLVIGQVGTNAPLTLHGVNGQHLYSVQSTETLINSQWLTERVVQGAAGQDWTELAVPVADRTNNLFLRGLQIGDSDLSTNGLSVSMTAPADGAYYANWPTNITMEATATSINGGLVGVGFYAGSLLVGFDAEPPYRATWAAMRGIHTLTARAFDSAGGSRRSAPVSVSVDPCYPAVDVMLVVDKSGSMTNPPTKLRDAKAACSNFVAFLSFPADQAGLVSFSTTASTDRTLTTSETALLSSIGQIKGGGNTYMSNAIHAARIELTSVRRNTNALPVMVFFSDGEPTDTNNVELAEAARAKTNDHIRIYTIGLGAANHALMRSIASTTNDYFYTTNSSELSGLFGAVAARLCRTAPMVEMVWPTNNTSFVYPQSFNLLAQATDADGGIASVSFYNESQPVGMALPVAGTNLWSFTWSGATLGTNTLTAVAVDNSGLESTSAVTTVVLTHPAPTVEITTPGNGQLFTYSPTNILLSADANASGGPVTNVQFLANGTSIGHATAAPWQVLWIGTPAATNYTITAIATDFLGETASDTVSISINAMPVVGIVFPTNGIAGLPRFPEGTNLILRAQASDSDGSITQVEFLSPQLTNAMAQTTNGLDFMFAWNAPSGVHALTACATDNRGASAVSPMVVFRVGDQPYVQITSPTNSTGFPASYTINLCAVATNLDNSITNVEFLVGADLWGADASAPFTVARPNCPPGQYVLTARATDAHGRATLSEPVTFTVSNAPPSLADGFWDPVFGNPGIEGLSTPWAIGDFALAVDEDRSLYVAMSWPGWIDWAEVVNAVGRWDGVTWHSLQNDVSESEIEGEYALLPLGSGKLLTCDGDAVARWEGTNWTQVGGSFSDDSYRAGTTMSLAQAGSDLYVGGRFTGYTVDFITDDTVRYVARADGTNWVSVGDGLNGSVLALAVMEGQLYAGGSFTNCGAAGDVSYIARLDADHWVPVGFGFNGRVRTLLAVGDRLFAGGDFTTAGGWTNANHLAVWDGRQWNPVGNGVGTPGAIDPDPNADESRWDAQEVTVFCLAWRDKHLFVGGQFEVAGSDGQEIPVRSIARVSWDEAGQQWSWSEMDRGLFFSGNWPGVVQALAIREGDVSGAYDVFAAGYFDAAGAGEIYSHAIARWSVGRPKPEEAPQVTITQPTAWEWFEGGDYPDIAIRAEVASTNPVASVKFYTDDPSDPFDLSKLLETVTSSPFEVTWSAVPPGEHRVIAVASATTDEGRTLRSQSSPVCFYVMSTNPPVVAMRDTYTLLMNGPATSLPVLANDTGTNGPLRVAGFEKYGGPWGTRSCGTVEISHDRSHLIYTPLSGRYGEDLFAYTATNTAGDMARASVTVKVFAAPEVEITTPADGSRVRTLESVAVSASAVDCDGIVTNLALFANGVEVGSVGGPNLDLTWSSTSPGFYILEAVAIDSSGISSQSSSIAITVTNGPSGGGDSSQPPVAKIMNLQGGITQISGMAIKTPPVIREGLFNLKGLARDPDPADAVSYQVLLFRPQDWADLGDLADFAGEGVVPLADVTPGPKNYQGFHIGGDVGGMLGGGTTPEAPGDLGQLDLTTVDNGIYDLVLRVRGGTRETNAVVRVQIESQLKIGQFSFNEQDLVIPVNGIPLTVMRTYNSLNPRSQDFGYSWSYALLGMDAQLDEERREVIAGSDEAPLATDEEDENGLPRLMSIRTGGGRNVTLTLPDGRRTTFTFKPRVTPGNAYAEWEAPPGVGATLKPWPESAGVIYYYPWLSWAQGGWNSTFENYDLPGWVLETQDGTKYFIERGPVNKVMWDDTGEGHFINVTAYGEPRLTRIEQRSGDVIEVLPDAIRHMANGTNLTRSVWFERDEAGRITAIRDPNSGSNGLPSVRYVYNRDTGNLIQVHRLVDREAGSYLTNRYHYNHPRFPHYITSIEDPRGVPRVRTLYGDDGKLVGMIDAAGRTNLFEHDTANRREIVYDRSGEPTVFEYDTRGNVIATMNALGHTNGFVYDENGFLTNSVDALGNRTVYSNDTSGNVLSVTVPHPVGAAAANYTTSFTWDQYGNQTSVRLPTGGVITNEFDANGNLSAVRDEWGNLISSTIYNSAGLPASEGDRFGALSYKYDSAGNLTHMTNSLNQIVQSGYDLNGNLTGLVDNGVTNSITYDALNRETAAQYGHGITVNYGHDGEGDWTTVSGPTLGSMERHMDDQGRLSGWTTANGATPGFAYDINGRLEFETNSVGAVTRSVYNAVGWLVGTTNLETGAWAAYGYDAAGRRVAQTNALGEVTMFEYWPSGSLKAMTNALGTNYWLYSDEAGACSSCGNSGSVTDSLGRVTEAVTSSHGLPLQTIRRASAGATGANAATNTITYLAGMTTPEQEAEEYPVSITDEGGRTRQYEYTALGQLYRATDLSGATWWTNRFDTNTGALTNVVSPTGETISYTYDELDNVETIRFGDGNFLTNFFDSENRLSGVRLPSGTLLTNFYDFAGRLTNRQARVSGAVAETASFEYNANDAVTRMTDNTGSTTNLFDSAGRLWGIDYPSGASVRYQLDLLDRISAVTNKASAGGTAYVTRYQRDPAGNVTNVIDPFNGNTSFEYDRVGRRTKRALPNGIVTEWQYNWKDQVTNIVHKTSGGSILASVLYERAAGGEPMKITREDGTYVMLKYDAALRLTNEIYYTVGGVPQTTNSYGYDASGSRIRLVKGGTTLTNAVTAGYRITAVKNGIATVESYTYDNGGRVTGMTRDGVTRSFGYNSADQVTAATNGASWITYRHDASGRRTISTNSAGTVRRFMVAPTPETDLESPHLIANAAGTIHQGYVYLGDDPILRYTGSGTAGYYLEDGMGSVIGLAPSSSPSTANTTRLFYDGFGNTRATNGPAPIIPTGTGGDFRFHGAWLESDSGLYNMRAREYDPRLGRFTSRDPDEGEFELPETFNPYTFANANPFVYSDPSGKENLVELNVTTLIESGLSAMRQVALDYAKNYIKNKIFDAVINVASEQLAGLSPEFSALLKELGVLNAMNAGMALEQKLVGAMCKVPAIKDVLYIEPSVNASGDAVKDGLSCHEHGSKSRPKGWFKKGAARPDFIISTTPPTEIRGRGAILVGEIKVSANRLYMNYVKPGGKKKQLDAICNFAGKHVETDTAVFLTVMRGDEKNFKMLKRELLRKTVSEHTLLLVYSVQRK